MDEKKIIAKKDDENEVTEKTLVVKELPMEPVRQVEENGIKYNLVTVEEFLTELANR